MSISAKEKNRYLREAAIVPAKGPCLRLDRQDPGKKIKSCVSDHPGCPINRCCLHVLAKSTGA